MKLEFKKQGSKFAETAVHIHLLSNHKQKIKPGDSNIQNNVSSALTQAETYVIDTGAESAIFVNTQKWKNAEQSRICGHTVFEAIKKLKKSRIVLHPGNGSYAMVFTEGLVLSSYEFLKYFSDRDKRHHGITSLTISDKKSYVKELEELDIVCRAVFDARTLVNEPLSFLTAPQLGKEIKTLGKTYGFKTEVFGKQKIETLKMGGLLAVNRGSIDPPSFSILEWKPAKAKNKKPIILVGKGVVYDTGGLSLKPTANSMDFMKSDMGGAAAVIGAMCAVSANKLPLHVIALVPATDNRPGLNAYAPGDVVTMYDGTTVEVLNTDAEGRMLLADALAYAKKYKPELVIDAATLTGAAARAIGREGIVGMGNAGSEEMGQMKKAGDVVCERIAEFPFWDEYADQLKSTIADVKNLGGSSAGAITAGKFLERFTDYPYIHLDVAGPAFMHGNWNYRGEGGTGVGVRLLYQFLKMKSKG